MSNVVYVYQWQGKRTKWNYQLEIIPSDESELTSPTFVQLPEGFIKNLEFNFAYDQYPIGFPESPTLSLTLDFTRINNDTQYNELKRAIFNPITTTNIDIFPPFAYQIKVKLGTIVNLKIQFPETNDFVKIFCGIYKAESKVKYSILTSECSLDAIAVEKVILESFDFKPIKLVSELLHSFNINPYVITSGLWELIIKNNPPNPPTKQVLHTHGSHRFLLRPFSFLLEQIRNFAESIAKKMLRNQSATFSFPTLPNITFYKQKYTGDGSLGNEPASIYYVERIERKISSNPDTYVFAGGLLDPHDEKSLLNIYKNSVWDFLRDYCEWQLAKGILTQNMVLFSYLLGDDQNYIEVRKDFIINAEIELYSKIAKTITASNFEFHSDDKYSDIEKFELSIDGTYNEEEITIPMIFNNIPACVDYEIQKSQNTISAISFFPHYHNLYYSEIDSLYEGAPIFERFIRIHEYCNYPLKPNLMSSSLPGCEFQPFNYNDQDFESRIRDIIAASQITAGMPVLVTKILNTLFTNQNQTYISDLTLPLDKVTVFSPGQNWYFLSKIPWLMPWTNIKLNLNELNNFITIPFQYWSIISSKVDFNEEIVNFELLSINV